MDRLEHHPSFCSNSGQKQRPLECDLCPRYHLIHRSTPACGCNLQFLAGSHRLEPVRQWAEQRALCCYDGSKTAHGICASYTADYSDGQPSSRSVKAYWQQRCRISRLGGRSPDFFTFLAFLPISRSSTVFSRLFRKCWVHHKIPMYMYMYTIVGLLRGMGCRRTHMYIMHAVEREDWKCYKSRVHVHLRVACGRIY